MGRLVQDAIKVRTGGKAAIPQREVLTGFYSSSVPDTVNKIIYLY